MTEIPTLSIGELSDRLRARSLSAVELMNAVQDRVDATHAELNAFVARRDRDACLADARAADERIARGEARPLEGIPLGVKDLENAEGLPNTEGSLLFEDRISAFDDTQVARLKAAGAIVVGKTNAPEFGYTAITKNLVYGVTHSPWNLDVTPGGSSGGSSAALAGGVCPLVTASDGGGSIRIPASFTGSYGLKVSYGRVPRGPLSEWDHGTTSVSGPLTRTVADAALVLDQVVGASACDPSSLPHPGMSYVECLAEALPAGTRFGWSPDLGTAVVQSDVAAVTEEAARVFEKAGHVLVPVEGGPPRLGREWGMQGSYWMLSKLHDYLPERRGELSRAFAAGLDLAAEQMTPAVWQKISEQRLALSNWCGALFEQVDLLLTPTVPFDPPPARGPFPSETEGRKQPAAGVAAFTIPFNMSWHPAASVRAGLSKRGLPVGLQIVGPRHREDLVLRASLLYERERPWHPDWPTSF